MKERPGLWVTEKGKATLSPCSFRLWQTFTYGIASWYSLGYLVSTYNNFFTEGSFIQMPCSTLAVFDRLMC